MKRKKKIIIAISVLLAFFILSFFIVPFPVSAAILNVIFGHRIATAEYLRMNLDDFEDLRADRFEFQSNKAQTLVGYRYYSDEIDPNGVVVMAHGFGGGGQNGYMDVAYYFVQNGFDVFAYDATANDESEGRAINGLEQGVIDLHYALEYVKEIEVLKDLPVVLWGHSWGGYSVSAALAWHSEVKAIASVAGFNRATDLMEAQGVQMVGKIGKLGMPYVNCIERMKFGKYALSTAMNGFASSDAGVLIAHSSDDTVVPIAYGMDVYYQAYKEDPRFRFIRYDDRGHTNILYSEERISYDKMFNAQMEEYFGESSPTEADIEAYYKENLNREIYCNGLNKELFSEIVTFYYEYL